MTVASKGQERECAFFAPWVTFPYNSLGLKGAASLENAGRYHDVSTTGGCFLPKGAQEKSHGGAMTALWTGEGVFFLYMHFPKLLQDG